MAHWSTGQDGTRLWYETFGKKGDPALLLMMGNSCDATLWPKQFCQMLSDKGLYVIRFDQRDTGLSNWIDFSENPYTLQDMAADALQLLRTEQIEKAHIVGFSTGGVIAELFALNYPDQVLTLTLMMTSIDLTIKNDAFMGKDVSQAELPPPKDSFINAILELKKRPINTLHDKIELMVDNFREANGGKAPYDREYFYGLFEESLRRVDGKSQKVGHESNHALATSATSPLTKNELKSIQRRTLVIAGEEDPILPPPHGEKTADAIPAARFLSIEGMGHVLNPVFFPQLVSAIEKHIQGN
ncbi:alpha/beta fold hydrolase [Estrella lausannensis]|uniref:Alpha/beta hydrolase n=1 Tax=Estrella lausannensis TaxID=483423 RepID=A0A0H5DPW1_9BACT|nr:alpha/beta hydrolase [Estrella lausannensis]CRX38626.1 Alpha/beta hydrolase [Estrella lausannensis]